MSKKGFHPGRCWRCRNGSAATARGGRRERDGEGGAEFAGRLVLRRADDEIAGVGRFFVMTSPWRLVLPLLVMVKVFAGTGQRGINQAKVDRCRVVGEVHAEGLLHADFWNGQGGLSDGVGLAEDDEVGGGGSRRDWRRS